MTSRKSTFLALPILLGLSGSLATLNDAHALALGSDFSADYTATSLGSVPGLPPLYGGLIFLDSDTLLIGGNANTAAGNFYTIDITRGSGGHITGFSGTATAFGDVGEYNDGGIAFGPDGVLFTSRWPVNQLGQTKPGSTDEDKIIDLAPLGVAGSHSALNFVPTGFGGAGGLRLVSYSGGQWYEATLAPDGLGTYDLSLVTRIDLDSSASGIQNVPGGPEGFVYIAAGNAGFSANSMLIAEYLAGNVAAYQVDANGNPLVNTRRDFLTGLTGAEGSVIDPVTNDYLFSTFGGGNQIVRVQGFLAPPPPSIPEPTTLLLIGIGLVGISTVQRRQRS